MRDHDFDDIYHLSKTYFLLEQPNRSIHLLNPFVKTHDTAKLLVAECFVKMSKWSEALDILEDDDKETNSLMNSSTKNVSASLYRIKGKIYLFLHKYVLAGENFLRALQVDPTCYQALDLLVSNHLLNAENEYCFLKSLNFKGDQDVGNLLSLLYFTKVNKQSSELNEALENIEIGFGIKENPDINYSKAEKLYYQCRFTECFDLTCSILESDPFHFNTLVIHLACLYELRMKSSLFLLAHKLVDSHPNTALAWFGVGW